MMFNHAEKSLALMLMLFGAMLLPRQIYDVTKSLELYWLTWAVVILGLIVGVLYRYMFTLMNWRMGYRRFPTPSIIGRRRLDIDIEDNFEATVTRTSELIFLRAHKPDDLIDVVDTATGAENPDVNYKSPDAQVDKIEFKGKAAKIFWSPSVGSIHPYVPYEHTMSYVSPSVYGIESFYHANYIDRAVGVSEHQVRSARMIVDAVAFTLPWYQSAITERRLFEHYQGKARRDCPQPVISDDAKRVEWVVHEPKRGRVYVLFCVYEGWEKPSLLGEQLLFQKTNPAIQGPEANQQARLARGPKSAG